MKVLAIDPGKKRVGLAACDELEITTRLLPQLQVNSWGELLKQLVGMIREQGFQEVVVGLPLDMSGEAGKAAESARRLAHALEKQLASGGDTCPVVLWDERLTTFEAEQRLRDSGVARKKARHKLDSLAAQVLLEDYLQNRSR